MLLVSVIAADAFIKRKNSIIFLFLFEFQSLTIYSIVSERF